MPTDGDSSDTNLFSTAPQQQKQSQSSSRPQATTLTSTAAASKTTMTNPLSDSGASTTTPSTPATATSGSKELRQVIRARDEALASLHEAELRIDELEIDLIKEREIKDNTPGALAFYATFSDPAAIITFHSLFNVLSTLKAFANCEEHLEFPILRNRLKQCISQLPIVDRFVTRYDLLHKRWTTQRMSTFADRGLTGSAADSIFTCPVCDCDSRTNQSIAPPPRLGISPSKTIKQSDILNQKNKLNAISRGASRAGRMAPPIDPLPLPLKSSHFVLSTGLESPAKAPLPAINTQFSPVNKVRARRDEIFVESGQITLTKGINGSSDGLLLRIDNAPNET